MYIVNIILLDDVNNRCVLGCGVYAAARQSPSSVGPVAPPFAITRFTDGCITRQQGEVQPGEQLLQNTLDVWKGPSMIITGDDDPTVPTQVRH